jgi:hypothetical protein
MKFQKSLHKGFNTFYFSLVHRNKNSSTTTTESIRQLKKAVYPFPLYPLLKNPFFAVPD